MSSGAVLPAKATAHISACNSSSSSSSNSLYLYVSCGGTQTLHKTHAQYMPLELLTNVGFLASTTADHGHFSLCLSEQSNGSIPLPDNLVLQFEQSHLASSKCAISMLYLHAFSYQYGMIKPYILTKSY